MLCRVGSSGRRLAMHSRMLSSATGMKNPTPLDLSKFSNPEQAQRSNLPKEALERDIELRREHFAVRKSYPDAAQPLNGDKIDGKLAQRKRLVYRARQRGWLEVDLLLGSWAADNIMDCSDEEVAQFEAILNCETLDIYNMVTKQMEIPDVLQTEMMTRLQEYAATHPVGEANPTMYEKIKTKMSN